MAKMYSKFEKFGSVSWLFNNLITIVIYVVAVYILYRVVMYLISMRSSAMPDIPSSSKGDKQKGGCSTGTCGGN